MTICSKDGCRAQVLAVALCRKHYRQQPHVRAVTREYRQRWRAKNREALKAYNRKRWHDGRGKPRKKRVRPKSQMNHASALKARRLTDAYVLHVMRATKADRVPPEVIEAKRNQIKGLREAIRRIEYG